MGFLVLGSTGLNLALAYETRARVALAADDAVTFQRCAALSAEQWRGGTKRLLDACCCERLRRLLGRRFTQRLAKVEQLLSLQQDG